MLSALIAAAALSCAAASPPVSRVDIDELLRLRDISGLSVSPDGAHVAIEVQQADPASNSYAASWCVVPIDGGAPLRIGDGGDIFMPNLTGLGRRAGIWMTLAARWSPDGQRLAMLARRDGGTFILNCAASGAGCTEITPRREPDDIAWSQDSASLIYRGVDLSEVRAAEAREALRGYVLDERFDLFHQWRPVRSAIHVTPDIFVVDPVSGHEEEALPAYRQRFLDARASPATFALGSSRIVSLASAAPISRPQTLPARTDVRGFARLGLDGAVWSEPADPAIAGLVPPLRLHARISPNAAELACTAPACVGRIVEFTPSQDGRHILFIRREGWGLSQHGLYVWTLESNHVRRLALTDAVVRSCTLSATHAICLEESAIRPRIVVAYALNNSARRVIFDANPHMRQSAFLPARKLIWRAPDGAELFGYLVEPERRRAQSPPPLVVVQYRATGFLRGGVGDEHPIQAFARRGFAVLALERPDPHDLMARITDPDAFDALEWQGLSERWRTLDALRTGIAHVVSLGLADGERVGVTGLSDGAETAQFAAIHCQCADAFAVSNGFHDPISLWFSSERFRRTMRADGRGDGVRDDDAAWADLSLARNVDRVHAPILVQIPDRELVFALESQRTFADAGRPFDLYVFPDEYHVKWQPAHRAAVYRRSLAWFQFWLQGNDAPDTANAEDSARWRTWRAAMRAH